MPGDPRCIQVGRVVQFWVLRGMLCYSPGSPKKRGAESAKKQCK